MWLLGRLLSEGGRGARVFRAAHEEYRPYLDELEQQGLLFRQDDVYRLSLVLLDDLNVAGDVTANSILVFCNFLLGTFYNLYKISPGREFLIAELAKECEATPEKAQRALLYLNEVPIFQSLRVRCPLYFAFQRVALMPPATADRRAC